MEDERKRGQKIVKKSRVSHLRLFLWCLATEGRAESSKLKVQRVESKARRENGNYAKVSETFA